MAGARTVEKVNVVNYRQMMQKSSSGPEPGSPGTGEKATVASDEVTPAVSITAGLRETARGSSPPSTPNKPIEAQSTPKEATAPDEALAAADSKKGAQAGSRETGPNEAAPRPAAARPSRVTPGGGYAALLAHTRPKQSRGDVAAPGGGGAGSGPVAAEGSSVARAPAPSSPDVSVEGGAVPESLSNELGSGSVVTGPLMGELTVPTFSQFDSSDDITRVAGAVRASDPRPAIPRPTRLTPASGGLRPWSRPSPVPADQPLANRELAAASPSSQGTPTPVMGEPTSTPEDKKLGFIATIQGVPPPPVDVSRLAGPGMSGVGLVDTGPTEKNFAPSHHGQGDSGGMAGPARIGQAKRTTASMGAVQPNRVQVRKAVIAGVLTAVGVTVLLVVSISQFPPKPLPPRREPLGGLSVPLVLPDPRQPTVVELPPEQPPGAASAVEGAPAGAPGSPAAEGSRGTAAPSADQTGQGQGRAPDDSPPVVNTPPASGSQATDVAGGDVPSEESAGSDDEHPARRRARHPDSGDRRPSRAKASKRKGKDSVSGQESSESAVRAQAKGPATRTREAASTESDPDGTLPLK